MAITHILTCQFKEDAPAEGIKEVCDTLLALKTNCLKSDTQKPYIKSFSGGRDNSLEGFQQGMTHGFVVEFDSVEDRDYYVYTDPAHQNAKKTILSGGHVQKLQVIDFVPGVF